MEGGTIDLLIFVVVLAALTCYVAAPLYAPARPAGVDTAERARLLARREALVEALREVELDRLAGGIDEAEHAHERATLEAEAAAILRALGALRAQRED